MSKKKLLLFVFMIAKIAMHYWLINPVYDLHRDEYLHLDQAKHLDWGYLSVPPVTSWVSYLILLLGNDVFWVKFFPALFGALTLLVVWKTVEELKGNLFALILASVSVLFSAVLRLNILYQPNSLDILLWTMLYFAVVKYIGSENPKWLYFLAISFGLGFLNKYNIVFLLLGLFPALFFSEHWKLLQKRHFYFAMLLALCLVSPNLFWQYQHDFPVFGHLNALAKTQLENINRIDFLKEQILFFIGSIWLILGALLSFWLYPPFRKYRIFFWSFVFSLLLFVYFKAKGYYAIGLYPILLAFGAVSCEIFLKENWKIYLRPVAMLLPIILFFPILKVAFPIYSPAVIQQNLQSYKDLGLLRWEDGKDHDLPQDFADMQGWRELAKKVDSAYETLDRNEYTLVLCDNYGQAGAINFYSKYADIQAVSLNADYINWFRLDKPIKNVILVQESTDTDKERKRERELFETVVHWGEITNPYAREKGTAIYLLKNAQKDINEILKKEILNEKGL